MAAIVFRQLRESDAQSVQAVALEAWRYTYRAIFDQQFIEDFVRRNYAPETSVSLLPRIHSGSMFFDVAERESMIVGFCNIGVTGPGAQLLRIYLQPAYIGQGLGRQLLQRGEAFVVAQGISTYFCLVHQDNELGKRFYLRNSFRRMTEKDHEDEWYMEKALPA